MREVRVRQLPDHFVGRRWLTKPQKIVRLGDVGRWSMCRVWDAPQAMPFVMSRKDWDKLPISDAVETSVNDAQQPSGTSTENGDG